MILEIDIGNSRLKWRLVRVGECVDESIVSSGVLEHFGQFDFSLPFSDQLSEVWVSNVLAGQKSQVMDWCLREYGVLAVFAETQASFGGVVNSYSEVSHMGVDRWLAVVAGYSLLGEVIVVDCGSACTIDIVSVTGTHQGGYILPGFTLMKSHLMAKMKRVFESSSLPTSLAPGCSTVNGLDAGLLLMLVGAVKQVQRQYPGIRWLFAGGDGRWLMERVSSCLSVDSFYRESLVLDGLSLVRRSRASG